MKRYLLTMLLVLFAAGGVGAYYAYTAADRLPEFKLVAVDGDPALGDELELSGSYGGRMRSQHLTVSADGSHYRSRETLFERYLAEPRGWFTGYPGMKQLIEEHREFMRGKGSPAGLYKDEEWLIYAEPVSLTENSIQVELLDLATGEMKQYTAALPEQKGLSRLYVEDVQRNGNVLHVVTTYHAAQHTITQIGPAEVYFDNVIDLTNGALIRQKQLDFGIDGTDGVDVLVNTVTSDSFGPGEYIVFRVREEMTTHEGQIGLNTRRLYAYSYKTGEVKQLPMTFAEAVDGSDSYHLSGEHVFTIVRDWKQSQADIFRYDLNTGEIDKNVTVAAEQWGGDKLWTVLVKNDRIYLLLHQNEIPQAVILDLADGALLYKGEAVYEGPEAQAEAELSELSLLNLNVRN